MPIAELYYRVVLNYIPYARNKKIILVFKGKLYTSLIALDINQSTLGEIPGESALSGSNYVCRADHNAKNIPYKNVQARYEHRVGMSLTYSDYDTSECTYILFSQKKYNVSKQLCSYYVTMGTNYMVFPKFHDLVSFFCVESEMLEGR